MFMLDNLIKDIKIIINSMEIKYDKRARDLETIDSLKESDRFISASLKQDSFLTYPSFDLDVIISAGVTNLELAQTYVINKNQIPLNLRDLIVQKQREKIIFNYVEKNNYYRELNGLPNYDDVEFVYVDTAFCEEVNISSNIPIHLYSLEAIRIIQDRGELEKIIAINPTKKYLKYLGLNKIDIVHARTSKNFSILRMTSIINESLYIKFNEIYAQCREYFMTVIYIKEYSKIYDLYDNFIAMMIMVMTIQRLAINSFKNGIRRDFYDLESIKTLFDVYGVPLIESLSIDYQRILLRNLNNLLRYKSTDKVLYDICSLLGFERMKLFKYFLIKEHILDINEKPVFLYKEIDDGNGGTITVEDKENMYNFYFQRVSLDEKNLALALTDSSMRLDYNQVVIDDPYWWEDEDLKNQLLNEDFNFIETKFIDMNIMYRLTEMLFEIIYVTRMIISKKSELTNITIELPKLFPGKRINLFRIIVFLCALLAKRDHMAGNILFEPSKILSIYGFNFQNDFTVIKNEIMNNPHLYDQQLLTYFEKMNILLPQDVNNLFVQIRDLNDFLINKMSTSKNIKEYRAYKNLFKTLMVSEESTSMFMKSDGTTATTFKEYLQDVDITLYDFIENLDINKISDYIDHVLNKLDEFMTDLTYLSFLNDTDNPIYSAIVKLIRFFKSYTTDLSSMNVLYIMDSRYYNFITLISDIKNIEKTILYKDLYKYQFSTNINTIISNMINKDIVVISDKNQLISVGFHTKDNIDEKDNIKSLQKTIQCYDNINKIDFINVDKITLVKDTTLNIEDKIRLIYEP